MRAGLPRTLGADPWHGITVPRGVIPRALLALERGAIPAGTPEDDVTALTSSGLFAGSGPTNCARRLLGPMATPRVVTTITSTPAAAPAATIWQCGAQATLGWTVDRTAFTLWAVEPGLLGFTLGGVLGIRASRAGDTAEDARVWELNGVATWHVATMWTEPDGSVGDKDLELVDDGRGRYWEAVTSEAGSIALLPRSVDMVLGLLAETVRPG